MLVKGNLELFKDYLVKKLEAQRKLLMKLPRGNYIKKISRGKPYYYSVDKTGKRIGTYKDLHLVKRIMLREKTLKIIGIIEHDIKLLDRCCKEYIPFSYWDDTLLELPHRKNEVRDNERNLVVKGVFYRSKSEMIIATILEKLQLEYVYEPIVKVGGRVFYPDFAIKRPKDGRLIYLEHFGMIFDEDYKKGIAQKIENYAVVGITLWNNLIMTFDDVDGGFNGAKAEKIIGMFLLD